MELARPRIGWDEYFMQLASLVATRSTCPRRRVGSVLVRDHRVIATGYNGSVAGDVHCDDVGCLLVDDHCVRTLHSELNALLQCAVTGERSAGSELYCTDFPCLHCAKSLAQGQVRTVHYVRPYRVDPRAQEVLHRAGVVLVPMDPAAAPTNI